VLSIGAPSATPKVSQRRLVDSVRQPAFVSVPHTVTVRTRIIGFDVE